MIPQRFIEQWRAVAPWTLDAQVEPKESIAIIYRSKSMVNEIFGVPVINFKVNIWKDNHTREFAKGKFLYDNGQFKNGFKIIEKVLLKTLYEVPFCSERYIDDVINKIGFVAYRTKIQSFINMLPQTDIPIGQWVVEANKILNENDCGFEFNIDRNALNYSFSQLFVNEDMQISDRNFRCGTVHSVKGETFEAVLLILKTRGIGSAYKTLLNKNISISDSEELRIAYVGMTRPSKILVIAVPDEENKNAWVNKLSSKNLYQ